MRVLDGLVEYREVELLLLLLYSPQIRMYGRLLRDHSAVLRHGGGQLLGPNLPALVDDVLLVHGDERAEYKDWRNPVNHREVGDGLA